MTRSRTQPYSELGKLLDQLARSRDVPGPKAITEHVREKTGEGPGRSGWHGIRYGDIRPSPDTVRIFAQTFELDEEEATRLAVTYVFGAG